MEQEAHFERPIPTMSRSVNDLFFTLLLLVVLPVLAVNGLLAWWLELPFSQSFVFGLFASLFVVWNLMKKEVIREYPPVRNRLLIVGCFAASLICFFLSVKFALFFAGMGMVTLALGICCLRWGTTLGRSWSWSFIFLFFSFPWINPENSLLSFPWRMLLCNVTAVLVKPLIHSVTVEGTTLCGDSLKMALTPDVGGFWQAQLFLLAALALVMNLGWRPFHRLAWFFLSLVFALAAYIGFVATFFVMDVLSDGNISTVVGMMLEAIWWLLAFGGLWWISRRPQKLKLETSKSSSKSGTGRPESMFPDDPTGSPGGEKSATV